MSKGTGEGGTFRAGDIVVTKRDTVGSAEQKVVAPAEQVVDPVGQPDLALALGLDDFKNVANAGAPFVASYESQTGVSAPIEHSPYDWETQGEEWSIYTDVVPQTGITVFEINLKTDLEGNCHIGITSGSVTERMYDHFYAERAAGHGYTGSLSANFEHTIDDSAGNTITYIINYNTGKITAFNNGRFIGDVDISLVDPSSTGLRFGHYNSSSYDFNQRIEITSDPANFKYDYSIPPYSTLRDLSSELLPYKIVVENEENAGTTTGPFKVYAPTNVCSEVGSQGLGIPANEDSLKGIGVGDSKIVVAGGNGTNCSYTTDGGTTWTSLGNNFGLGGAQVLVGPMIGFGSTFLCARQYSSGRRLYRSFDGGTTWDDYDLATPLNLSTRQINVIRVDKSINRVVIGLDYGAAVISNDGGVTFSNLPYMLGTGVAWEIDAIDVKGDFIIACVATKTTRSLDGGVTWEQINSPTRDDYVKSFLILDENTVIAGCAQGWAGISYDAGTTWYEYDRSLNDTLSTTDIHFTGNKRCIIGYRKSVTASSCEAAYSTDLGHTWTEITAFNAKLVELNCGLNEIVPIDEEGTAFWAICTKGRLIKIEMA